MSARAAFVVNYVAYQVGWIAAVGGAATGHGRAGAALGALLTLGHLAFAVDRRGELRLVAAALATGAVVESWQIASGTYRLLDGVPAVGLPPAWLLVLWAQFATTFRFSLARVMTRPWAAALFGAAGGPLAFLAGERLGAVTLSLPILPVLVRLVTGWAIALVWLSWLTRAAGPGPATAYRAWRLPTSRARRAAAPPPARSGSDG